MLASRFQHAAELGYTMLKKGNGIAATLLRVKPGWKLPPGTEVQSGTAQTASGQTSRGGYSVGDIV